MCPLIVPGPGSLARLKGRFNVGARSKSKNRSKLGQGRGEGNYRREKWEH